MKNAEKGAKIDRITEKRHFPMFFSQLLIIQFHLYTNRLQSEKMEYIENKTGQKS